MGVFRRTRTNKDGKKVDFWYMRYVINGKETWKSAGKVGEITKTVAQKMLEDIKRNIRMGTYQFDVKNVNLESLEKDYINYVKNISQIRTSDKRVEHMNTLKAFFGDKELINYTSKDIDDFKSFRLKKVAPATVNRELSTLRHLFNLAKRWKKFFGDNPVSVSGLLREDNLRKRVLSFDEEARLLECSAYHLRPIILTALYTGLRKSEILSLVWKNVDFNNNIIIIPSFNNKSKKEKTVPLSSILRKLLLELKLKNSSVSEYVFLNNRGNNIKSIKTAFNNACRREQIKDFHFHDLRHTAGTRMLEAGVGIVEISEILGHSSIELTRKRYLHPNQSLRDAVEKLANFNKDRSQNRSQEICNAEHTDVSY